MSAPPTAPVEKPTRVVTVLTVERAPMGRAPLIFAVLSLVVALGAGAAFLIHRTTAPPLLTPEETVSGFLSAVFLAEDPVKAGEFTCAGWSGQDAINRTAQHTEPGSHVSWDQVRTVFVTEEKASATARIGQRLSGDNRPSLFKEWQFSQKYEKGWRVCEARPIGT